MKQLYEVGEKVYLQSRSMPQYNGQYIVEAVHAPNTREACKIGKGRGTINNSWTYSLGFEFDWKDGVYEFWQEGALRKYHEPSQQSFKDLMTTLKSPQKVEWD